ncbi:MAG TPA: hypothetical protein VGF67_23515 [Ktedonobacteraceae bacterium]
MSKALSRTLYLLGLLAWMPGGLLLLRAQMGSTVLWYGPISQAAHSLLVTLGICALLAGSALSGISWIGALIQTARLGRRGWFVCLLLFSGLALLVYIFRGPQYAAQPSIPVTTPYCGVEG